MDRLDAMALLVDAVDGGSLSAAGRRRGVPLPTVSRKLSDLEAHLGTRLLIRSTRKLALTDAGVAYLAEARRILDLVSDAERAAAGEYQVPRGELVLTAPIMFGRLHVLPIATDFLARYPDINVRLVLSDRNAHLIEEHVDMAVRIGVLPDSSMTATHVGDMRFVICASPAFLAAYGVPRTPDDIAGLPSITHDFVTPAANWLFRQPGTKADAQVSIAPRLSVTTAEAALEAAIAGVGLTRLLTYQAAAAVASGALQIVLAGYERPVVPVSLVHAAQALMPLKMRSFLDVAAPRLRRTLSAIEAASRLPG